MEKENNNSIPKEKFNFFKRAKTAIFNLEKYSEFAKENVKISIKYLFLLTLILALFQTILHVVSANELVNKVIDYVRDEFPVYTYEDNKLDADQIKTAYDEEFDFYFAIDTKSKDNVEEYRNEVKKHSIGLILLNDEAYVYSTGEEYRYTYSQLSEGFSTDLFNTKNKLLENLESQIAIILIYVAIVIFISLYINYLLVYTVQLLAIALMVYVSGKMMNLKLKFGPCFSISVYSVTLSTILTMIYTVVNLTTSFRIVHFDLMYNIIIYIYAICAIVMIKLDDIKQKEEVVKEVRKIEEVQEEVHKELEETKKDENKEKDIAEEDKIEDSEEKVKSQDENNEEDSEKSKT